MRWVLGLQLGAVEADVAPTPSPVVLAEPAVTLKSHDGRNVTFEVEPYVTGAKAHLMEVRVYVAPEGATLPTTADEFVASSLPFGAVDASATLGGDITIVRPEVSVRSVARAVYGFES